MKKTRRAGVKRGQSKLLDEWVNTATTWIKMLSVDENDTFKTN